MNSHNFLELPYFRDPKHLNKPLDLCFGELTSQFLSSLLNKEQFLTLTTFDLNTIFRAISQCKTLCFFDLHGCMLLLPCLLFIGFSKSDLKQSMKEISTQNILKLHFKPLKSGLQILF